MLVRNKLRLATIFLIGILVVSITSESPPEYDTADAVEPPLVIPKDAIIGPDGRLMGVEPEEGIIVTEEEGPKLNNEGAGPYLHEGPGPEDLPLPDFSYDEDVEMPEEPKSVPPKYIAYIPKTIRLGFEMSYTINLLDHVDSEVKFESYLTFPGHNYTSVDVIQPGKSGLIKLGKIPAVYHFEYWNQPKTTLKILGFKTSTGEKIFSNETKDFSWESKSSSLFIQSDKPMYKPGQTIKFRGIFMSSEMKPLNNTVTYTVQDSNNNLIMMKKKQPLQFGVISDEIEIHPNADHGYWRIKFTDDVIGMSDSIRVKIEWYKLPKFEVKVENPSYIASSQSGFTIKVNAKYTFGKPVKGAGICRMSRHYYWGPKLEVYDEANPEFAEPGALVFEIDGQKNIFVDQNKLQEAVGELYRYSDATTLDIKCVVKEKLTGEIMKGESQLKATKHNLKLETILEPEVYKPGFGYKALLKVTEFDGKPLQDNIRATHKILVDAEYRAPWRTYIRGIPYGEDREEVEEIEVLQNEALQFEFEIPSNGLVELSFDTSAQAFDSLEISAYIDNVDLKKWDIYKSWNSKKAESESGSFIEINTENVNLLPGEICNFQIKTTEEINSYKIMVLSRGKVVLTTTEKQEMEDTNFSYDLEISYDMQPSAVILVSYVREDGEIVADYITITVELSFENKLEVSTSSELLDAGDEIQLSFKTTDPGSFLAVSAIDKSVLLLDEKPNDITGLKVKDELQKYSKTKTPSYFGWWCWFPLPSGGRNFKDVFENADILLLQDVPFPVKENDYRHYYDMMEYASMGRNFDEPAAYEPRSDFPETWIWLDQKTNENGEYTLNTKVPDTITSWEISAFAVSQNGGLGVADISKVTVFRNFFVNLNLPLKVIRGEIIIVQAVVFNYFKRDLQASLKLVESDDFNLEMPVDDLDLAGPVRKVTIPADSSISISFPVRMTTIGDVDIKVVALSNIAYDSLIRTIHVKPEGIEQCFSQSVLFMNSDNETLTDAFDIIYPDNVVPGSARASLYIYGDVMGSTVNNLGDLLKEPTGCGEQNMVSFAPDVFITLYLEKTNQLTKVIKDKAYKHFLKGYQNQLNYKRSDNSFSAFGNNDKEGSLWLTTFVMKVFSHAKKLDSGVAEQLQKNWDRARGYVLSQYVDGNFVEKGKLWHKDLQGGVNSNLTMAAYVAIALLENKKFFEYGGDDVVKLTEIQKKLENNLVAVHDKPYELSILTYALHLYESDYIDDAFEMLEELKINEGANSYWGEKDDASAAKFKESYRSYYEKEPSKNVETTSYALLTYVLRGLKSEALPVLKWLTSKRSTLGGYSNTQDTVIAIQAMSAFAGEVSSGEQNLNIQFTQGPSYRSINLNKGNFQVQSQFDLDVDTGYVLVEASGSGMGVAQMSLCYNIVESPYEESPFKCAFFNNHGLDFARMDLCCSLSNSSDEATGMLLFKYQLPSGFTVKPLNEFDAMEIINTDFWTPEKRPKKMEMQKDTLNVYFDELSGTDKICDNIEIVRVQKVAASQPGSITVMDYYKPKRSFVMPYSLQALEISDICQVCPECGGCQAFKKAPGSLDYCPLVCESDIDDPDSCQGKFISSCPYGVDTMWDALDQDTDKDTGYECHLVDGPEKREYNEKFPAIDLDLKQEKPFLKCSGLASKIENEDEFTFSFIVKMNSFGKRITKVFEYGNNEKKNSRPTLYMYHTSRPRSDFRLFVHKNGRRHRILRINPSLFEGKFAHVLITFSGHQLQLYVNGQSTGVVYTDTKNVRSPQNGPKNFYFGRNSRFGGISSRNSRRVFPGSFSSSMFWESGLTPYEASSVYDLYKDELTQANDDKMVLYNPQMALFMTSQRNLMQNCSPFHYLDPLDTLVRVETLYKVAQTCSPIIPPLPH